jgi:2-succinyl-5-enolpyruvyl-6-hydroxy-3-cyclohexene-1-carboxylate synthase
LRNENIEPNLVIRFGSKPASKILCNKLNDWNDKTILVDSIGRFNDNCKIVINSRIKNFCEKGISQNLRASKKSKTAEIIKLFESKYRNTISDYIQNQPMFEGSVVTACIESLKKGDNLILGNSMPIRDADMFTPNLGVDINVFANRGTSGIDGVTSTAMGIAAITSLKLKSENTMLITGDLAFFYDLSGLYQSMRYGMKLTIVVINNKGGGIFSFLPVSNYGTEYFEEFWLTNPNLSIPKAAQLFNCLYFFADNIKALNESLESSRQKDGVTIIEVSSDMNENTTAHKALLESLTTK